MFAERLVLLEKAGHRPLPGSKVPSIEQIGRHQTAVLEVLRTFAGIQIVRTCNNVIRIRGSQAVIASLDVHLREHHAALHACLIEDRDTGETQTGAAC